MSRPPRRRLVEYLLPVTCLAAPQPEATPSLAPDSNHTRGVWGQESFVDLYRRTG
jgi:hypothetical protein